MAITNERNPATNTHHEAQPLRILLVEDNDAHTKLILRAFKEDRLSNPVHCVRDGEEALDYLFHQGKYKDPQLSPRPDLILLDLKLPKIDGVQVLKRIKSEPVTAAIPVVVLTSSVAEFDVADAYAHHVNSYLAKPIDFEKFHQMVQALGFYWTIWNKSPK